MAIKVRKTSTASSKIEVFECLLVGVGEYFRFCKQEFGLERFQIRSIKAINNYFLIVQLCCCFLGRIISERGRLYEKCMEAWEGGSAMTPAAAPIPEGTANPRFGCIVSSAVSRSYWHTPKAGLRSGKGQGSQNRIS